MHCPNCGTRVAAEQKFCRACGLGLQTVAQLLAQQLAENPSVASAERAIEQVGSNEKPVSSKWRYRLIFAGICLFMCGPMLFVIAKALDLEKVIFIPATFAVCIGTLIALYGTLIDQLHSPKKANPLPPPVEPPAAETTSKLELASGAEPVLSVIENTTRHLEPAAARPNDDRNL